MSFCCCSISSPEESHLGYSGLCQDSKDINPRNVEQKVTLRSEDEIMTTKEMEMKRREENMQQRKYKLLQMEEIMNREREELDRKIQEKRKQLIDGQKKYEQEIRVIKNGENEREKKSDMNARYRFDFELTDKNMIELHLNSTIDGVKFQSVSVREKNYEKNMNKVDDEVAETKMLQILRQVEQRSRENNIHGREQDLNERASRLDKLQKSILDQTGEKKKKLNRNRSCSHHTASSSGYETNPSPADSNEMINSAENSP